MLQKTIYKYAVFNKIQKTTTKNDIYANFLDTEKTGISEAA
jgi:hypothetical protein